MSILSKMISYSKMALCLIFLCVLGAITAQHTIFVPFIYAVIYGCAYIFWKANHGKFPYYFHICLIFLISNNNATGLESVVDIIKCGLLCMVILLVFTFIKFHKKQLPLYSTDKSTQGVISKYIEFFKENPVVIQKTLIHSLIMFIISWAAYLVYDHMGYWLIISAGAVLIGGDYGKISIRGKRRIVGAFISMLVLVGLVFCNANSLVLIAFILLTMKGVGFFMPHNYIMGSACISINVVACNLLASGNLNYTIVIERVLWTIVGAILTLALCYVFDKLLPTLYQDYTKEKLIVAKN